jgi:ABC-type multidrug transport system ATPase subunit
MSDPAPVASLRDIHLSFAGVTAVDGVSFDVMPGELFAIIGPNGAGKTSTARSAARPSSSARTSSGESRSTSPRWAWPAPSRTSRSSSI